jgi:hypothetical protein
MVSEHFLLESSKQKKIQTSNQKPETRNSLSSLYTLGKWCQSTFQMVSEHFLLESSKQKKIQTSNQKPETRNSLSSLYTLHTTL